MLGLLLVHDSVPLGLRIGNLCAVCHLAPPKGFAVMMLYWCNLLEAHWGALHAGLEPECLAMKCPKLIQAV